MSRREEPTRARSANSPWAPLRHRQFLVLWTTMFAAFVGSTISDSAAAWLMTTLASSPVQVALVQSAMMMPVLLLGLPAGALADLIDRRSILIATQVWVTLVALALFAATLAGKLTAELLLALTFANGVGIALRMPVMAALTPELVPRTELGRAVGLSGVAMNGSRIVGPMLAGVLLGWLGGAWVFLVYAAISVAVVLPLARWKRPPRKSSLPSEGFLGAMRLGAMFARRTPMMIAVLVRSATFCFFGIAMLALLPLIARERLAGDAGTYTLLLSAVGTGAIAAVAVLPPVRRRLSRDQFVAALTLLHAVAILVLAQASSPGLAAAGAFLGGAAWIAVLNAFTVAAQSSLPDWVRARGMAVFQAVAMAGATLGSVVWGQVAAMSSIEISLVAAGTGSLAALALVARFRVGTKREFDLTPIRVPAEFATELAVEHEQGPVLVTVEYLIDPARSEEFAGVMAESRRFRLSMGATYWGLFRDASNPGRFVEHFTVGTWVDRLRQIERLTAEDVALWDRKSEFHIGPEPVLMTHFIMEPVDKR